MDVRARVILCVSAKPQFEGLVRALEVVGFDVRCVGHLAVAVNAVGPGAPVVVVDDEHPAWLRQVADLLDERPDACVLASVMALIDGGVAIPRGLVPTLVAEVRHGRGHSIPTRVGRIELTDREWQILQLLAQRRTTREIADSLFVSAGTVRSHVSSLLKKVGAVDREDLLRLTAPDRA